jgi:hypothetical protein
MDLYVFGFMYLHLCGQLILMKSFFVVQNCREFLKRKIIVLDEELSV